MKSVYVDDTLHRKLKRLAQENRQTLLSLLNRLVREGIEQMEKKKRVARTTGRDPIGMFGVDTGGKRRVVAVEDAFDPYQEARYPFP